MVRFFQSNSAFFMAYLNPDTLAAFSDFMSPDELRDFLTRVRQEWRSAWPRLQDRLLAEDWEAVRQDAHRLKSTMGSVGCDVLYGVLNDLENALRAEPRLLPGQAELAQLQTAAADAEDAFERAIQSM